MSKTAEVVQKTKAKAGDFMPTKDEMLVSGATLGGVVAGIVGGHAIVTALNKQDNVMVNGAMLLGGFYGACKLKHPFAKALCIGAAAFGGIKLVNQGIKQVTAPGTTEGLNGMLPESVKTALRKYIPNFSAMSGVNGLGDAYDNMGNADDEMGDLSLDDVGQREEFSSSEDELVAGLGNTMTLVA